MINVRLNAANQCNFALKDLLKSKWILSYKKNVYTTIYYDLIIMCTSCQWCCYKALAGFNLHPQKINID